MRIDRLLWCLRFARSRTLARKWVDAGHIRHNGRRVAQPSQMVRTGDILTLPLAKHVLVIEILAMPQRRGPAEEARACYRELDAGAAIAIAGGQGEPSEGHPHP